MRRWAFATRAGRWKMLGMLSLLVVVLAALLLRGMPSRELIAERWLTELESLAEPAALKMLDRVEPTDDVGTHLLVAAMGSRRASVARQAGRGLLRRLDRWQLAPPAESTRKIDTVARLLSQRIDRLHVEGRPLATDVARRCLLWPIDKREIDSTQLVDHCETILRGAKPQHRALELLAPTEDGRSRSPSSLDSVSLGAAELSTPVLLDQAQTPLQDLPRHDVPWEIVKAPTLPPVGGMPADSTATASTNGEPRELPIHFGQPIAASELQPADNRADESNRDRAETAADPNRGEADIVWMRRLHSPSPQLATAAANELLRRGFTSVHLRLAELLTSENPADRIALAGRLPETADLDPRPWLLWLSHDDHADVRRAAIAVMASSSDPTIQRRLRELTTTDADPSVISQLKRLPASRQR